MEVASRRWSLCTHHKPNAEKPGLTIWIMQGPLKVVVPNARTKLRLQLNGEVQLKAARNGSEVLLIRYVPLLSIRTSIWWSIGGDSKFRPFKDSNFPHACTWSYVFTLSIHLMIFCSNILQPSLSCMANVETEDDFLFTKYHHVRTYDRFLQFIYLIWSARHAYDLYRYYIVSSLYYLRIGEWTSLSAL